jgi:APA family basic amino acid/polyamine antiporter
VNYIGFILSLSAFLTVMGVFVLRVTQPRLPRPYRTWGYPVTPVVFLLVTGWMMFFVIKARPLVMLAGAGTLCVGLVVYVINKSLSPSAPPPCAPSH